MCSHHRTEFNKDGQRVCCSCGHVFAYETVAMTIQQDLLKALEEELARQDKSGESEHDMNGVWVEGYYDLDKIISAVVAAISTKNI